MRRALIAALGLLLCAFTPSGTAQFTVVGDNTNYQVGPYDGYMNPFCAGGLTPPLGYNESMSVAPTRFPSATLIQWSWPSTPPPSCGIYTFPQVSYGNYDGGSQTITAKQLSAIQSLNMTFSAAYAGDTGYDVISDRWCWSTAGQGAQLCEIEVGLHLNATLIAFFNTGTLIGSYTDIYGRQWKVADVANTIPDYVFLPTSLTDITSGSVDLQGQYAYLIAQGKLTGSEWFTGFAALGAEPRTGSGSLTINSLAVAYN